jgi:hypothetical protein
VIKFVLIGLAILFLLPLLRRKEKPETLPEPKPESKKKPKELEAPKKEPEAKATFDALMRTVVLLLDNDWVGCTIDGVNEDWARFASAKVCGFSAIPGGRHRVVTEIGGRAATLDFVLLPGDVLIRRLDRDAMKWVELEGRELETQRASAEGGEKGELGEALVSYRSTMGIARVMSGKLASPEAAFDKAKATLSALVDRAENEKDVDALVEEARAAGEALIGVALVAAQLDALAAIGKRDPTKRIVDAALPGIATR